MITLSKQPVAPTRWVKVNIGKSGDFEVLLKRPTWADLMADAEARTNYVEGRLKACVYDWRGVSDDAGNPVIFNWDNFQIFCTAFPFAAISICEEVGILYAGLAELDEKNSPPSPGEPSAATENQPERSTSTADSATSGDSQKKPG